MSIIYFAKYVGQKNKKTYVYVGKTSQTLDQRREQHEQAARSNSPTSFHQALIRFGLDNFEWDVLNACDSSEEIEKEKEFVDKFCKIAESDPNYIVLNDSIAKKIKNENVEKQNTHIPKANRQCSYKKSEIGKKLLIASGKLKPVINLKTGQKYESALEASRVDNVSIAKVRNSFRTGKRLLDGSHYALLDLNDNPILTDGHKVESYIGKNAKKVKELVSGKIYESATKAAFAYVLSDSTIDGCARGKYLIAKGTYVFCFLDKYGNEIRNQRHEKALEILKNKDVIKYVAWHIDDKEMKNLGYFKDLDELCERLNLKKAGKSHIKEVCEGKRSHVECFRVAYYDKESGLPILTPVR